MRQGIALVVSAPSGAGKSSMITRLISQYPRIGYSVSCTTRAMRPGEIDGQDYFFLSGEDFEKMRAAGQFAEWAQVHGNFYGTPLAPVQTMLAEGKDVLFDIDVQGAAQIRASLPDATFVFILPPSMAELKKRMQKRGTESAEHMAKRLGNAMNEIREAFWYNAMIVNDDLAAASEELAAVYRAATLAPGRNQDLLAQLLEEAEAYNGAAGSSS